MVSILFCISRSLFFAVDGLFGLQPASFFFLEAAGYSTPDLIDRKRLFLARFYLDLKGTVKSARSRSSAAGVSFSGDFRHCEWLPFPLFSRAYSFTCLALPCPVPRCNMAPLLLKMLATCFFASSYGGGFNQFLNNLQHSWKIFFLYWI